MKGQEETIVLVYSIVIPVVALAIGISIMYFRLEPSYDLSRLMSIYTSDLSRLSDVVYSTPGDAKLFYTGPNICGDGVNLSCVNIVNIVPSWQGNKVYLRYTYSDGKSRFDFSTPALVSQDVSNITLGRSDVAGFSVTKLEQRDIYQFVDIYRLINRVCSTHESVSVYSVYDCTFDCDEDTMSCTLPADYLNCSDSSCEHEHFYITVTYQLPVDIIGCRGNNKLEYVSSNPCKVRVV
ncbi:hypothetical protein DRN75_00035 [Nanoarchaeota archaeon]|nr:MAG: hypothetical protein DRN75_00035 [Nanoarchaeota archaeon]